MAASPACANCGRAARAEHLHVAGQAGEQGLVPTTDRFGTTLSVEYHLSRTGGYSPLLGRALVRASEAAGVAERMWAPDFRDRMLVVARRP